VRFVPPFLTFHPAHVLCCMMWWTLYPALGCKGSGASFACISGSAVTQDYLQRQELLKAGCILLHRSVFLPVFVMVSHHHHLCVLQFCKFYYLLQGRAVSVSSMPAPARAFKMP